MNSNSRTVELRKTILSIVDEKNPQTVKELLTFVHENALWSEKEILDAILKLQDEGIIKLARPSLPVSSNFSSYLKSNKALWFWATVAIAILTMTSAFLINADLYPWSYIRNVLGMIFVLWLPGYVVIKALFPVRAVSIESSSNLSNVERIALSIIMSLALVAIIGLFLNFSPWGINLTTIVLSLLTFSLVFAIAAIAREYNA